MKCNHILQKLYYTVVFLFRLGAFYAWEGHSKSAQFHSDGRVLKETALKWCNTHIVASPVTRCRLSRILDSQTMLSTPSSKNKQGNLNYSNNGVSPSCKLEKLWKCCGRKWRPNTVLWYSHKKYKCRIILCWSLRWNGLPFCPPRKMIFYNKISWLS